MVVISILILLLINAAYSATIVLITKNTAKFPQAPPEPRQTTFGVGVCSPLRRFIFSSSFQNVVGKISCRRAEKEKRAYLPPKGL